MNIPTVVHPRRDSVVEEMVVEPPEPVEEEVEEVVREPVVMNQAQRKQEHLNPCNPVTLAAGSDSPSRRWAHVFPRSRAKTAVKWVSMAAPACLPLTTDFHPLASDLSLYYEV